MFRKINLFIFFGIVPIFVHPQSSGLRDSVAVLENRTMGDSTTAFGSCFLWTDPRTQKNYIIACEHVVRDAHHLAATFQKTDGELVVVEDIEIVLTDKHRDLAFLSIGGTYRRHGLKVSLQPVEEGMTDVWSAGFPALGLSPVFQISKGYITNSAVKIIPHGQFFQHTANISAASSGGPLITAVETAENNGAAATFVVLGVNSMAAKNRGNTFFAIPSPVLADFIERALKHISPEDMWEKEGNNTRDTATAIRLNNKINGTFNPLHDEDWYRLDIPAMPGEPVDALVIIKGNDGLFAAIYDAEGESIDPVKDNGIIRFRAEGGPVFICIKQASPYFDSYFLKTLIHNSGGCNTGYLEG
ncbi:MAG: serine protease [Treponema sp.]|jgi:hypothetical protein|nr:serine protease [Treponema sp.]